MVDGLGRGWEMKWLALLEEKRWNEVMGGEWVETIRQCVKGRREWLFERRNGCRIMTSYFL